LRRAGADHPHLRLFQSLSVVPRHTGTNGALCCARVSRPRHPTNGATVRNGSEVNPWLPARKRTSRTAVGAAPARECPWTLRAPEPPVGLRGRPPRGLLKTQPRLRKPARLAKPGRIRGHRTCRVCQSTIRQPAVAAFDPLAGVLVPSLRRSFRVLPDCRADRAQHLGVRL
jgi:hypothetical protein